ncbi:DUF2281 domain-containing protein [Sedimentibacter sp.]|uniref:DUF2281 domain-containing protein n=1 Tax=Sedimentibacter sp. TaxID=1960295 RepID=UPI0028AEE1B5|nr:DUF2281 domain-containing protein [Sedimentibacter sp.]
MIDRDLLVKKIEDLPFYLLEEVADYIDYVEFKRNKEVKKVEDITIASEDALSKDWLRPEEEETWKDL